MTFLAWVCREKATLGENIAAIDEALNAADAIGKALMPFTPLEKSGIGQGTYRALAPFAATLLEHLQYISAQG